MSLTRLEIAHVRNITQAEVALIPGVNLLFGENGSGKTSVLEAVYCLGSARTYRNNSVNPLISTNHPSCLVRGTVQAESGNHNIGVSRSRDGNREIRVDGQAVKKATELAALLPTLIIGPDTVNLLLGPPSIRRRFLNWGVFHVEPSFTATWNDANRCLRQRNELLRRGAGDAELAPWTRSLVSHAELLDQLREGYMERYVPLFQALCQDLMELQQVTCEYRKGWGNEKSLTEDYEADLSLDRKRGYTQRGFQRADVRIRVAGEAAAEVCSRGELKLIAWALTLAQGNLLDDYSKDKLIYLVDDMASELDARHQQMICKHLVATGNQVIATGIDRENLERTWHADQPGLFHVEHGSVTAEESMNDR